METNFPSQFAPKVSNQIDFAIFFAKNVPIVVVVMISQSLIEFYVFIFSIKTTNFRTRFFHHHAVEPKTYCAVLVAL